MAELIRRALGDLNAEDFENIATDVYARHMSQEHLTVLAQFAEGQTGKRFFTMQFAGVLDGTPLSAKDIARQFNADEITEIIKFGQSEAAAELKRQLPAINQDMAAAGQALGKAKMEEYIAQQKQ